MKISKLKPSSATVSEVGVMGLSVASALTSLIGHFFSPSVTDAIVMAAGLIIAVVVHEVSSRHTQQVLRTRSYLSAQPNTSVPASSSRQGHGGYG